MKITERVCYSGQLVGVIVIRLTVRLVFLFLRVFDPVYYLNLFVEFFACLLHNKA